MRDWINLTESFYNAFQAPEGYVEIYVNPSKSEFSQAWRTGTLVDNHEYYGVRGFLDGTTLYVWAGSLATHGDVDEHFGLWGQRLEWFAPNGVTVYWNREYEDDAYPEGSADSFETREEIAKWIADLPCMKSVGTTTVRIDKA